MWRLSVLLLVTTCVLANDHYVSSDGSDSNPGTQNQPWATFSKADSVAVAGDTIHVLPGTYSVTRINTKRSGTAANRITWVSDVKWAAHLVGNNLASDYIWQSRGDYVTIQGFDVSGPRGYGIRSTASFTVLAHNHVHNLTGSCSSYGGAGIYIGNYIADGGEIYGNIVHDVAQNLNVACSNNHGIYTTHPHVNVYNNMIYRNWAWGIQAGHAASDSVISHNLVYQNGRGAISVGGDSASGYTTENTIVSNNLVIYNGFVWTTSATVRENDSVGIDTNANQFLNNLFFGNRKRDYGLINGIASGSIDANPMLANYQPDGSGDYHLTAGSPAIDAGVITSFSRDFDGILRPQGSAPDIGPYEYAVVAMLTDATRDGHGWALVPNVRDLTRESLRRETLAGGWPT